MSSIGINELLTILVVFSANIVEAITGFAGTMLAMPASMQLIGVMDAKIVLNVVALFVSGNIWLRNRQDTDRREVCKISGLMIVWWWDCTCSIFCRYIGFQGCTEC